MNSIDDSSVQSQVPGLLGFRSPLNIHTVLTWLVLACLLPGMIGASILMVYEYRTGRAQLEKDTMATARALVQAVDSHLLRAKVTAETIAGAESLARGDLASFHRWSRQVMAATKAGDTIVLSDASGQQLANTLREFGEPLPRHGNPELLSRVFATKQAEISGIYIGGVLRKPVMSIDVPVVQDGKVAYCVSVGLAASYFNEMLIAQGFSPGWVAGIFDSTGTLAGRIPSPEKFVGQKGSSEFIQRIKEAPEGSMESVTLEGIPTLSSWSRSPVTGWSVGIGIPRAELEKGLRSTLYLLAAGILVLLAGGLGLAWMAGRKIAGSVHALTAQAMALGSGASMPVTSLDIREAAEVADAIGHAAELLEARTTALEGANKSLLARETELKKANRLAKLGHWRWNVRTGEVTASESVREIYGRDLLPFQEQKGTLLPVESWEKLNAAMQEAVHTGVGYDLELQVTHGSGSTIWINAKCEVDRNAGGEVTELLGTVMDITERKHAELALDAVRKSYQQRLEQQVTERTAELMTVNQELEHLARKDVLTGLQNRIAANERLRLEFLRMKRTGSIYSVLFMDIDRFKAINDTYGHETGDQVLRKFAKVLVASSRESDLLARFGGEEFLAVLSDTGAEGAMTIAEKIRQAIADESFPVVGRLTVSIGATSARAEDENEEVAVRRADAALYLAKAAGRNVVRFG